MKSEERNMSPTFVNGQKVKQLWAIIIGLSIAVPISILGGYYYNQKQQDPNLYEDGYAEGYLIGLEEGNQIGWNSGNTTGFDLGLLEGNASGYILGFIDGYALGYSEGYADGYADGHDFPTVFNLQLKRNTNVTWNFNETLCNGTWVLNGSISITLIAEPVLRGLFDMFNLLGDWYINATGNSTVENYPYSGDIFGIMFDSGLSIQMDFIQANASGVFTANETQSFYREQQMNYYIGFLGDGITYDFSRMGTGTLPLIWGSTRLDFAYNSFNMLGLIIGLANAQGTNCSAEIGNAIIGNSTIMETNYEPAMIDMRQNNTLILGDLTANQQGVEIDLNDPNSVPNIQKSLQVWKNGQEYLLYNNFTYSLI
jgi:hypothetical protein